MTTLGVSAATLACGINLPQARAAGKPRRFMSSNTLQHWLDRAAASDDKVVVLPAGDYVVDKSIRVPPGVIIVGQNERAPYSTRNFPISQPPLTAQQKIESFHIGSTFVVTATDGPALEFQGDGCEVHGCTFYYPDQDAANPQFYPPTISASSDPEYILGLAVRNNLFVNVWDAIKFGSPGLSKIGQILIDGNRGQVLNVGIDLGQVLDMVDVRDTHFWPFWAGQLGYTQSIGLRCYESDWLQVEDFFTYGMAVGIQLVAAPNGRACSGTFHRINIDACNVGVDVYALANWGVTFRDLNVVCQAANPFGGDNTVLRGIWGHPGNEAWALDSNFTLDGFRVEGALVPIAWDYEAPLVQSNVAP